MARQALIQVVDANPNDQIGGGGCLCSDTHRPECRPPYVLWPGVETDSGISPHAVACARCLQDALLEIHTGNSLAPTTDQFIIGGHIMGSDERIPGTGPRDATYVPVDGEDAYLPRDGSPGAGELPSLEVPVPDDEPAEPLVIPDAPPSVTVASLEPVSNAGPVVEQSVDEPEAVAEPKDDWSA